MANQVVWCDIPVKDLDRAIRFYTEVLGKTVTKHTVSGATFGLLPDAESGVSGCLCQGDDFVPSPTGPLIYLNCEGRLAIAIAKVDLSGGKLLKARHSIAPHGFRALVLDTEGNRIALHAMS